VEEMNTLTKKDVVTENETKVSEPDAREKIFRAAEELFIERGHDGVSVNDIAEKAGVAKALVFYYFESKKNLFDNVLDVYYKSQAQALIGALTAGGTARQKVHAGMEAYLDFVELNPGYARLIQREICSRSQSLEKIAQYMEPLQRWGEVAFGALLPGGGAVAPRHFFVTLFGLAINYYTYAPALELLWKGDPLAKSALAERREHVRMVVDAMLDKFADASVLDG